MIMPTHGYGVFRRFLLGSVTSKVLHDLGCPVLTGAHLTEQGGTGKIAHLEYRLRNRPRRAEP